MKIILQLLSDTLLICSYGLSRYFVHKVVHYKLHIPLFFMLVQYIHVVFQDRFANHSGLQASGMDGWVRVLCPFNSISVISRRWKSEYERLCAMKRRLGSGRISPQAGFEPATP